MNLEDTIQGTWWLLSRTDKNKNGIVKIDPILGSNPLAILVYANNRFAAQFMKRNRKKEDTGQVTSAGNNNTSAIGGYDAYFGTYKVRSGSNIVQHTLEGSINPDNIGLTVDRILEVSDNKLKIELETSAFDGEAVIRTLIWERISS